MNTVERRRLIQWLIAPIVIVTIALGWRYPWLGFSVPVVMAMGLVGSFFNGRYVCGNLCPRGAFWDRFLGWAGPGRSIPAWLRNMPMRVVILVVLMGLMLFNIGRDPADWRHWGRVFWMLCAVTTGVGVLLALAVHPRGWCAVCPMGTLQALIGGRRRQLRIDTEKCRKCYRCEKICPLRLPIVSYREEGVMRDPDCLKCSECVAVCPFNALRWQESGPGGVSESCPQCCACSATNETRPGSGA